MSVQGKGQLSCDAFFLSFSIINLMARVEEKWNCGFLWKALTSSRWWSLPGFDWLLALTASLKQAAGGEPPRCKIYALVQIYTKWSYAPRFCGTVSLYNTNKCGRLVLPLSRMRQSQRLPTLFQARLEQPVSWWSADVIMTQHASRGLMVGRDAGSV